MTNDQRIAMLTLPLYPIFRAMLAVLAGLVVSVGAYADYGACYRACANTSSPEFNQSLSPCRASDMSKGQGLNITCYTNKVNELPHLCELKCRQDEAAGAPANQKIHLLDSIKVVPYKDRDIDGSGRGGGVRGSNDPTDSTVKR